MKTIIKKQIKGFDQAVVSEDAKNYRIDLKTGLGEGVYPKSLFTLEQAINDQVNIGAE